MVADQLENDEEGAEHFKEEFAVLSRCLASVRLQPHVDPEDAETWSCDMYGYSGLHYLRRVAAHLHYTQKLPVPGDENSAKDNLLARYYEDFGHSNPDKAFGSFDHLIIHSDAEGYYIPQDFERVLIPGEDYPVAGGMVGSSQRLQDETRRLAAVLGLPLDLDPEDKRVFEAAEWQRTSDSIWETYGRESYSCLRLFHAATRSIATGTAIVFS